MSYPGHLIAGGIDRRVYTKALDERGGLFVVQPYFSDKS